jgi:carboxypeptidase family protein/TonB-dependent receptor-like protein
LEDFMQQKLIIKAVATVFSVLALLATTLFAQLNTGKIEGTVQDKDTGKPLQGAQVTVEGTRLGNVTNADGYYFILNVPPGQRDITFTFTGYQKTTVANQLILAGQTTTVDGNISSTVIQLEGITVAGESEVLVPRDNVGTKQRITSTQIEETPTTRLEDMMILEAGVQIGGRGSLDRGVRIRGGRSGEEAVVVDGMTVRNYTASPYRRPFRWGAYQVELHTRGEDTTPLEISNSSVEEVDIITGGFQAEYGNAQSGIINIVTKEGGAQLRGAIRYTTDAINPRTADWGYNQIQTDIGGPFPGINNLYFQLSGEIQGQADRYRLHADEGFRGVNQDFVDRLNYAVRNDPELSEREGLPFSLEKFQTGREFYASRTGNDASLFTPLNPVRASSNWGDRTLVSSKLTFYPIKKLKILATHNFSRNQHAFPPGWNAEDNYFQDGWFYKGDLLWDQRDWGTETAVHVWNNFSRRNKTNNFLSGFNWDIFQSSDSRASLQFRYSHFRTQDINTATPKTNWERSSFMNWSFHDIQFECETWPNKENPDYDTELARKYLPDGMTGYKDDVPYESPFAIDFQTAYYINYRYMRERQHNFKADLDFQINRYNRAKMGFTYNYLKSFRFVADYHTPSPRNPLDEFIREPQIYSAYIQNRTDLGDFVFDYGLRYDGYAPMANWLINSRDLYGEDAHPMVQYEWSPRFAVGFPVTDKAQLRFSYGAFYQLPSLNHMYGERDGGHNYGDLGYCKTDAFETGLSYILSDDMYLDFVGYYRDVEGNVAMKNYFVDYYRWHTEERVRRFFSSGITNRDNGNIKGMDLSIRRRFSDNISFNFMYSLQFSRTTGSNYQTPDMSGNLDPSTNETYVPPDELRPIDGDRTHKLTLMANYLFPEDFQAGSKLNLILKNFRVYGVFSLQSGEPMIDDVGSYATEVDDRTVTRDALGRRIGGLNFFRGRWYTNLDLRFTKSFSLGKSRRVSVFTEFFNVLNRRNNYPYPSGYRLENFSHITGGLELVWDELDPADYRRVRFNSDFNGDGILTVEESALGEMAQQNMLQTMDKRLWGNARDIRTGISFTF